MLEQESPYQYARLKAEATATDGDAWREYLDIPGFVNPDTGQEHTKQRQFVECDTKRVIIRAGRRGGKTFGIGIKALRAFRAGKRVLYTAPTATQVEAFWYVISAACAEAVERKLLRKNETRHLIEVPGTQIAIRAKTAWNAATLRGDYGDLLIFDEYQDTNEDAWGVVGAPMLIDNNGDACFIYTPPSLHSRSVSKASDPRHASKLFKKAKADTTGHWQTFHFRSHDNPHVSAEAIELLTRDMTALAYRQEIEAEDSDESPGALWKRDQLEALRLTAMPEGVDLRRIVVGVDPPGGRTECGIIVAGLGTDRKGYLLADYSLQGSPDVWGNEAVSAYYAWDADLLVAEKNYGGDMVEHVIKTAADGAEVRFDLVTASRGKAIRAEPIAAQYERERCHHVGTFSRLEDEMCEWETNMGMDSPNRLDALVWAFTELMPIDPGRLRRVPKPQALKLSRR